MNSMKLVRRVGLVAVLAMFVTHDIDAQERRRSKRGKNRAARPKVVRTPKPHIEGLTPLTELTGTYEGATGGLYGDGKNEPEGKLLEAAKAATARITPLDEKGNAAADGKIVLLSVGMSNTTKEFRAFQRKAEVDPDKASNLVIVDGAIGSMPVTSWSGPYDANQGVWQEVTSRIQAQGVTRAQVQVVWIKQALKGNGTYPDYPNRLKNELAGVVSSLKQHCPNVKVVYLSSRIYAGYAMTGLSPEPAAFLGAFGVRSLILEAAERNAGDPVLLWGPYLWANGTTPRKSDGLVWERQNLAKDGTHPSPSGAGKVAGLLLKFFKEDPMAKTWFTKSKKNEARKEEKPQEATP